MGATVRVVTTVLDIAGTSLVVAGVAFVYWPAAVVLAGVACLAASWRLTR